MTRPPDGTTDAYLDVLRTLGVTDAALRRHHDAGPETSLRVAIDGDRDAPTADLLSALASTGRVLDLRDGLDAEDGDRLTAALGRFGYAIEASAVEAGLELTTTDAVTGETELIETTTDGAAVRAALQETFLDEVGVELRELLDGRHLVAEPRELGALATRYGDRIQPFDDPLLAPDAAIESGDDADRIAPIDAQVPASATEPGADDAAASAFRSASNEGSDERADAGNGPRTHTIEDDEDLAAAASTTIGGGPRRTVSTSGIDDVFDQLESSTTESETRASADGDATDAVSITMSDSDDAPTDASETGESITHTPNGLTGGPTRTVSSTSADDILHRATGGRDFEEIAAEEGDADPDAVLADAEDVPPALQDDDATPPGADEAGSEPESGVPDEASEAPPDTDSSPADLPPTDPPLTDQSPDEPSPAGQSPTEQSADEATAEQPDTDESGDVEEESVGEASDADEPEDATQTPPATPSEIRGDDLRPASDASEGLGDELLDEDAELRRGNEAVDGPAAPEGDFEATEADAGEPDAADGPLAAASGIRPDDATGSDSTDDGVTQSTGISRDAGEAGPGDGTEPESGGESDGESGEAPDDGEEERGLVGRITSTIFGR